MTIPETKYAGEYLRQRGITVEPALSLGIEIQVKDSHPRGIYRSRLGFDQWGNKMLPDLVEECIWFPCKDAQGNVQSYFCRIFPELVGREGAVAKFLTPKDGAGFPFIPSATWDVAHKPNHPVFITEGPIKAIAILQAGELPIGLAGVWMATVRDNYGTDLHPVLAQGFQWRGRKVYLVFDADFEANPFVRQALIRALILMHSYGAEAAIVRWPVAQGKGIDDFLAGKAGSSVTPQALFAEMYGAAVPLPDILKMVDLQTIRQELTLSPLKGSVLRQFCRSVSKPLNASASMLYDEVLAGQRQYEAELAKPVLPDLSPRSLDVILGEICEILNRYVVLFYPEEQSQIIALWIVHTWLFAAFDFTPYLYIFSPAWRSGKSRLLELLKLLCRLAELSAGASAAALIRINSEENPPTLLLDELDTVYSRKINNPEADNIQRFLNAGYERGATFLRCVGQGADIAVQRFPAFGPKAFAAIGQCLPDTVADRSIPIEIQRQTKDKRATKLRKRSATSLVKLLRDELTVLAADKDLIETLKKARPAMPDELNDRQQDICEPLLTIADHVGGDWPQKARDALIKLSRCLNSENDVPIRLLADIKKIFDKTKAPALFTRDLLDQLIAIADDAPWPDWFEKPIKDGRVKAAGSKLAANLKKFGIKRELISIDNEKGRGYRREQFESAWQRYLSEDISSPTPKLEVTEVTQGVNPPDQKDLHSNLIDQSNLSESEIRLLHKPIEDKDLSGRVTSVTSENGVGEEKIQKEASEPEKRLGYMPLDQTLNTIREVFPNATIIPDPGRPVPDPNPAGTSPESQPELPF